MKVWIVKRFADSGEMLLCCDSKQTALESISRLKCDDVVYISPVYVNTLEDVMSSKSCEK